MGGITSGVGIFSGINSAQLIDQLISLESRPKQLAQKRILTIQGQQAAFLDINTAILGLKTAASKFGLAKVFRSSQATSSDPASVTATASATASPGTFNFLVKRLVTTQQSISRGFTDSDTSAVGATSISFEIGGGGLASETRLSDLNGGAGARRGKIEIKDASGATALVDLSTAVTVNDVLDAVNSNSGISVKAALDGDRVTLTDTSGATGTLSVTDGFGSFAAADLGIAQTTASGVGQKVTGAQVRTLSGATALSSLNDGAGVNFRDGSDDLVITDRAGTIYNIDFGLKTTQSGATPSVTTVTQTRATTLDQIIGIINQTTGGKVTASLSADKSGLVMTDTTGSTAGNLIVRSTGNGRTTAADLGIETVSAGVAASTVTGRRLISAINSTLVSSLRGGAGLTSGAVSVTDRAGNTASLTIAASALAGSVSDVIADLNGQLSAAGVGVSIAFNRAGNGLALTDGSGGAGNITISGTGADQLGLTTAPGGAAGTAVVGGANLQSRWISRATQISTLNAGRGIGTGSFRVTDSTGVSKTIEIASTIKTVDEFIQHFNSNIGTGVTAAINATGDGIVITDTNAGAGKLTIADVNGTVARSLNLVGSDDNIDGSTRIDGSFERKVSFAATDSLQVVADKINAAGVNVAATIIRDGSGSNPVRLSFTSRIGGSAGRAIIDTGGIDLGLTSLSRGQDSLVFFGASDPAQAILLSSSSNTLDNVAPGVTIDIKSVSANPVQITVTRDTDAMEKAIGDFVDAFNNVLTRMDRVDSFDSETNRSGALFGDGTISALRTSLFSSIQGKAQGIDTRFEFLFEAGVKIGKGAKLEFNREKFRAAFQADPASVENLFAARSLVPRQTQVEVSPGITVNNTDTRDTFSQLGVAEQVAELAGRFTNSVDGTLTRKGRSLTDLVKLQQARIAQLDIRLGTRREILQRQFNAMEQAIASLQSQSSSLGSIGRAG